MFLQELTWSGRRSGLPNIAKSSLLRHRVLETHLSRPTRIQSSETNLSRDRRLLKYLGLCPALNPGGQAGAKCEVGKMVRDLPGHYPINPVQKSTRRLIVSPNPRLVDRDCFFSVHGTWKHHFEDLAWYHRLHSALQKLETGRSSTFFLRALGKIYLRARFRRTCLPCHQPRSMNSSRDVE